MLNPTMITIITTSPYTRITWHVKQHITHTWWHGLWLVAHGRGRHRHAVLVLRVLQRAQRAWERTNKYIVVRECELDHRIEYRSLCKKFNHAFKCPTISYQIQQLKHTFIKCNKNKTKQAKHPPREALVFPLERVLLSRLNLLLCVEWLKMSPKDRSDSEGETWINEVKMKENYNNYVHWTAQHMKTHK